MTVSTSGPTDKPISNKKISGGREAALNNPINRQWAATLKAKAAKETAKQNAKRPAGLMGSADAMERQRIAAKKGRSSFGKSSTAAGAETSAEKTMADLLAEMFGMGGSGGGGGSARAYSDEQVAATQAKLQAIYNRHAQDIAAREADIAANYAKTGESLGSIYDAAVGNVNSAYDAARAAQTQQLLNLGMTEQTPVQSFGNQTGATTSLQNLRAAVLAQNEATKNAAITNQRLASEAAQREGAQVAAKAAQQMASEMVSTGGGGGGGGGLSPYQYASLLMQNQRNEDTKAYNAAKLAGSQTPRVDPTALIAQIKKANPSLTDDQAIKVAQLY